MHPYQRLPAGQESHLRWGLVHHFDTSSCAHSCALALSAESALVWAQGNKVAQDVGGLIDIILSNAMSLANSMPDITSPLATLGTLTHPLSTLYLWPCRTHLQMPRGTVSLY
jgi:hypothetical protein